MAEQAETIAISQGATEGNRIVVSASPLLGIKALPTSSLVIDTGARYEEPTTIDLTTPKQPEVGAETEAPASQTLGMSVPISPHQKILSALASEQSVAPMPEGTPLQPSAALQPTTQPEAQPETQPQTQPGPETTQPEQPTGAPPEGQTPPGETPGTTIPGLEELRNLLNSTPGAPTPTPEPPDTGTGTGTSNADQSTQTGRPGASNVATLARQVLGQIEIPEIDHLATRATSQGVYFEHMRKGEQLLAEARWFEAEERFTAALAIIPGNALAAAGRVHAQIGAGMYLSAAVNLRNLFRAYPEFIPVRFSEQLLPRGDRLATIEAQLRQRAERDTSIARDAALLMAYLGHQYDDRALVEEGFRTLDRVETNLALEPDPLDEALRAVWLEGKE
jgi:hypothetical protein